MSDKQHPALQSDREPADDISALCDAFSLKAFRYIDIARQERLATLHARWPLLAEWDALHKKEQ